MKTIPLNKGILELPDSWEDLTFKQKLFAFGKLKSLIERRLDPQVFRIEMLKEVTGYCPGSGKLLFVLKYFLYKFSYLFVAIWYYIKWGKIRFSAYFKVWIHYHKPTRPDKDILIFNLYRLSENIDFAFKIEQHKLLFNRIFIKNPIPYIKLQGKKYTGRKFVRDIAPFTNITPKEFSDCFDLYSGYINDQDPVGKEKCMNRIISILYPGINEYKENLVSEHADRIASLDPALKFGIIYWFSGIIEFYMSHPSYSVLFSSSGSDDEDSEKITLGMNGVVLMTAKNGYNLYDKDLNDFFDAQLQILKDNLSEAVAKGATVEDLAQNTKLSINDINNLL